MAPFFKNRENARSHSRAGIGLGTAIKFPLATTTETHNERHRGQRPNPVLLITQVPLHHKRPVFALFMACLIRQQAE
jgi:hypothetical protein